MHSIEDLPTPCLLLDPIRMQRNIDRLQAHLTRLNVVLRLSHFRHTPVSG